MAKPKPTRNGHAPPAPPASSYLDAPRLPGEAEHIIDPRTMTSNIEAEIKALNRAPFKHALVAHLQVLPSKEALAAFAAKAPDRHAQSIAIYARLAGYSDKLELGLSDDLQSIAQMSDAALRALALEQTRTTLKALPPADRAALLREVEG